MRYVFAALVFRRARRQYLGTCRKRVFNIANNADAYGVDRCLVTGAICGAAIAAAYCKSRDFAQVASSAGRP